MKLAKRLNKLREKNRSVVVRHYSLAKFEGPCADTAAMTIGVFLVAWIVIAGVIVWWLMHLNNEYQVSQSPVLYQLRIEKEQKERDDLQEAKKSYIDGCKSAGKAPTDMDNNPAYWKCSE